MMILSAVRLTRCFWNVFTAVKYILMTWGLICIPIIGRHFAEDTFWVTSAKYLNTRCIFENDIKTSKIPDMKFEDKEWHDLHSDVKGVLQGIATGFRYARSGATIASLRDAFKLGKQLLDRVNQYQVKREIMTNSDHWNLPLNQKKLDARVSEHKLMRRKQLFACPEKYIDGIVDRPLYQKSLAINCSDVYDVIPLSTSLTIVLNFVNEVDVKSANRILDGIANTIYRDLSLILVVPHGSTIENEHGLKIQQVTPSITSPKVILSDVMSLVKTPYVLMTRNIDRFDQYVRLERLMLVASFFNVDIVAGSHRQPDGKWRDGCLQISFRNYTVRMIEGYDLSYNSSLYCDYVTGPFLAHTGTIKYVLKKRDKFIQSLSNDKKSMQLFYVDFFLTLTLRKSIVTVSPDVMFHTTSSDFGRFKLTRDDWLPLAKAWDIHRFYFSDVRIDINYSCDEIEHSCPYRVGGIVVPPCCYKELTGLLNFAANVLEKGGIVAQLSSGTLIGAVKISNTLPWEIDHDITLPIANKSSILKIMEEGEFRENGYTWKLEEADYLGINSRYFKIEGFLEGPQYFNGSLEDGMARTRVLMGGQWRQTAMSPGLLAKNRYGLNVYQHAEHWRPQGLQHSFISYENVINNNGATFMPCPRDGHQGCTNHFLPDGNLQFRDHWI